MGDRIPSAWTRDGRSIVYSSWDGEAYLWSVRADGSHAPERLEAAGLGAIMPTVAASTNQIVFARSLCDIDIFEFRPGSPAVRVVGSTFLESGPAVSPDGRRLAFSSARSGQSAHIWIANRDGSDIRQLTHGPGVFQGSPRWSPDASRIAFDAKSEAGSWNVWVIDADGGTPQPITNIKSEQVVPSWSRDGRWINFAAGEWDPYSFAIWRVPVSGGPAQRLTPDGTGRFASETADGTRLVYQAAEADSALMVGQSPEGRRGNSSGARKTRRSALARWACTTCRVNPALIPRCACSISPLAKTGSSEGWSSLIKAWAHWAWPFRPMGCRSSTHET